MLKKLFGGLFTIILLLLVTTLSLVLVVRNVTSRETINDMLNIFFHLDLYKKCNLYYYILIRYNYLKSQNSYFLFIIRFQF